MGHGMGIIVDDNVHIEPENDITTAQAGNRTVEIGGLDDLVVSTRPISQRTDLRGNDSLYVWQDKLCYHQNSIFQIFILQFDI